MTDWNAVSAFMAAAVPWPGSPGDLGWVNLHYSYPSREDPKVLEKKGGWPKKSVDSFIGSVAYALKTPSRYKDVWFCTSLQRDTKTGRNGKILAARSSLAALTLKSIWVDVDVGPTPAAVPGKPAAKPKYATIGEALKAIRAFQTTVGLPAPSAVVYSGGGIHVYWISKDELSPAEWLPYASGLKQLLLANNVLCDASITTDAARILRVPGTKNYKYDPPADVTLAPMPLVIYDFPAKLAFLQQFAGLTVAPTASKPQHPLWADDLTDDQRASFGRGPVFKIDGPDLNAGINRYEDKLVDPREIFKQCGFYREALRRGGADYDNPLWMYSVLGATFMEGGNAIAHAISEKHATYTQADTQALYDRKVAERADRGIGYPSCAAIQSASCKSCATCPLFAKGKSPLNIRPAATATATNTSSPSGSSDQVNWTGRSGISFANIPHRKFLYGFDLVRGELPARHHAGPHNRCRQGRNSSL
jgi:hypothetical protein